MATPTSRSVSFRRSRGKDWRWSSCPRKPTPATRGYRSGCRFSATQECPRMILSDRSGSRSMPGSIQLSGHPMPFAAWALVGLTWLLLSLASAHGDQYLGKGQAQGWSAVSPEGRGETDREGFRGGTMTMTIATPSRPVGLSLGQSHAWCERLARREAGNFYHAFHLLPAGQRRAMWRAVRLHADHRRPGRRHG